MTNAAVNQLGLNLESELSVAMAARQPVRDDNQVSFPWSGPTQPPSSVLLPVGRDQSGASNKTAGADELLAPAPYADRFPLVIGNQLTLAYLTATYRLATEGYRYQLVDVLNELLEHDPYARGLVRQRLLPVVAARLDVVERELPKDAKAADKKLALDVATEVRRQLLAIPARTQALGRLAWGIAYGMSGAETEWDRDTSSEAPKGWEVRGLHFIHSRRLNCTNPQTWDIHIYDQSPSSPWTSQNWSLGVGLRVASYPGKFVIHCPALNGDYATRDGELRYVGTYLALKRMIVRCSAQDFERVIRPWVIGYFNREQDKNKNSVATNADIAQLLATIKALGLGSLSSAVLPDAARVEILKQVATAGNPKEFVEWIDHQVTVALLGQTYTTGPQHHGTHQAADVANDGTRKINEYDAQCLCDTLERDLVYWIVALNWDHNVARRFAPTLKFAVSDKPDPKVVAEVAKILTSVDVPLDARKVGDMAGMPVIDEADTKLMETGRTRAVAAGKDQPIEPEAGNDPNTGGTGAPAVSDDGDSQQPASKPVAKQPADKSAPAAKKTPKGGGGKGGAGAPAKGSKAAAKKGDENGAAMRDRGSFLLSDKERSDDTGVLLALLKAPVSQIGDRNVAVEVYEHLLEDYPASALGWIPTVSWSGPLEIPVDEIDFSNANKWQASHEDIGPYAEKIRKAGGNWKPVVLVKRPGNDKFMIVDGHHRVLGYKKLGWPVRAYVATVPTVHGDWEELHSMQRKGTSKGSWADENSPSWTASHQPSWATKPASYNGPGKHPLEEAASKRPPSVNT